MRHFSEGRHCCEPPCTLFVQQSRMLMQKRPLYVRQVICWGVVERHGKAERRLREIRFSPFLDQRLMLDLDHHSLI